MSKYVFLKEADYKHYITEENISNIYEEDAQNVYYLEDKYLIDYYEEYLNRGIFYEGHIWQRI